MVVAQVDAIESLSYSRYEGLLFDLYILVDFCYTWYVVEYKRDVLHLGVT